MGATFFLMIVYDYRTHITCNSSCITEMVILIKYVMTTTIKRTVGEAKKKRKDLLTKAGI